jgi:hypothetical protein
MNVSADVDVPMADPLLDRTRSETLSGEARLALAVVEDAVMTVRLTTAVQSPRARRLAAEAWAWLASRETAHPFAFENLCDHLGLDAAWIRRGLRRAGFRPSTGPVLARWRGARIDSTLRGRSEPSGA